MAVIRHRAVTVDDRKIFVREAGEPSRPTLVLLPGYPGSTRVYVRLIDRLAQGWHTVAVDYPGFGLSEPLDGTPTFDRLADATAKAIDQLGVDRYAIYMFDYGAPVGFRVALQHDQRVRAIVTQNGNAYAEGLGPATEPLSAWWQDREAHESEVDAFVGIDGTRMQWLAGVRDEEHVDPQLIEAEQATIDLPGRHDYMKALLWDYRTNPPRYPDWQAWLRRRRPRVLAVWGEHDPIFVAAGAEAYRRDVPDAEVVLLDTGHFALEEEVDAVARHTDRFLRTVF